MFIKSLFIRNLLFCCFTVSLSVSVLLNDEMMKKISKRQTEKDFNHPANLVRVQNLQRYYDQLAEDVRDRFPECKTIDPSLKPAGLEGPDSSIFDYIFQEWWSVFKYSEAEVIKKLNAELKNLTTNDTIEEKASLMASLNYELCKMFQKKIVYERSVMVNESDVESVISALQLWGLKDKKLLNAARLVHRLWDGQYLKQSVVWPRKYDNSTKSS